MAVRVELLYNSFSRVTPDRCIELFGLIIYNAVFVGALVVRCCWSHGMSRSSRSRVFSQSSTANTATPAVAAASHAIHRVKRTGFFWKDSDRERQARKRFFKQHQNATHNADISVLEKMVNLVEQLTLQRSAHQSLAGKQVIRMTIDTLRKMIQQTPADQVGYFGYLQQQFAANPDAATIFDEFLYFYRHNLHFFTQGDYAMLPVTYTRDDYHRYVAENHNALGVEECNFPEWVDAFYQNDAVLFGHASGAHSFQRHIPFYHAVPQGPVKGIYVYFHGWHDSHESMRVLLDKALAEGYEVYAFDHRCHGLQKSTSSASTDDLRIDFRKILEIVRAQHPGTPLHVGGHSMGGAICAMEAKYMESLGVASVTLFAPAILSQWHHLIWDKSPFTHRNMAPEVLELQRKSPLFGGKGPNLVNLLGLMCAAYTALEKVLVSSTIKWIILQGERDQSVSHHELRQILGRLGTLPTGAASLLRAVIFPELDHGLHMSPADGKRVLEILFAELNKITPAPIVSASAPTMGSRIIG